MDIRLCCAKLEGFMWTGPRGNVHNNGVHVAWFLVAQLMADSNFCCLVLFTWIFLHISRGTLHYCITHQSTIQLYIRAIHHVTNISFIHHVHVHTYWWICCRGSTDNTQNTQICHHQCSCAIQKLVLSAMLCLCENGMTGNERSIRSQEHKLRRVLIELEQVGHGCCGCCLT